MRDNQIYRPPSFQQAKRVFTSCHVHTPSNQTFWFGNSSFTLRRTEFLSTNDLRLSSRFFNRYSGSYYRTPFSVDPILILFPMMCCLLFFALFHSSVITSRLLPATATKMVSVLSYSNLHNHQLTISRLLIKRTPGNVPNCGRFPTTSSLNNRHRCA